jgi:hypothetical protein
MKKTQITFVILVLIIGTMSLLCTCSTTAPAHLIIQPDPDNPFQGTWVALVNDGYILVVEGTNWTQYARILTLGVEWRRISVGKIEKKEDGFHYAGEDRWSIENDILTIGGGKGQYERYIK